MEPIILVAASGLAREVIASTRRGGTHIVTGLLDDDPALAGTTICGVPVVGSVSDARMHADARFVLCAGKGQIREFLATRLATLGIETNRFATVIDATAVVPACSAVGVGSILLAHTVLTADVRVGRHVVTMPNVTLTHDNELDDFATLTAGVSLGGGVRVGRGAYLGMNASVREYLSVGAGATVGTGAAVVHDVPDGETWVGVPAHPLGRSREKELNSTQRGRRG